MQPKYLVEIERIQLLPLLTAQTTLFSNAFNVVSYKPELETITFIPNLINSVTCERYKYVITTQNTNTLLIRIYHVFV